ncbi:MAG: argininosuccinate lyase, partial [Planctomycetales bacterium]|nr:argininosuccinate lyase [Planctomycetales bacterium]
ARVIGNLQSLLVLIKGLPLAYNRDLQEDKLPLFDSVDTVTACLELAVPLVTSAELNRASIVSGLDRGYLDATTLMEFMIAKGVPQRTAHHLVGHLVGEAIKRDVPLSGLPVEVFSAAHELLDGAVYDVLGVDKAVEAFCSYGSTSPEEVKKQINRWKERLG